MTKAIPYELLLVDNYDSFTFNVYQYLKELGANVTVVKNDALAIDDPIFNTLDGIILSPGPGTPAQATFCTELINTYKGKIPFFGVCLGHQVIAEVFGAQVIQSDNIMHGKSSNLTHNNSGVFEGLEQDFKIIRYHSLIVDPQTMPDELEITAWVERNGKPNEIMGLKHKTLPIEGVQFHPEAILSQNGHQIFENFLKTLKVKS